jgi:hypothetical protein
MPVAKAHLITTLGRYEAMLEHGLFELLDKELFEETWQPAPDLLTHAELATVGPLIVEFEMAVADRNRPRAREALERARGWVRQRGPT